MLTVYNSESTGHIVLKTVLYLTHIFDTEKFAETKWKVKVLMVVTVKINLEYSLKVVNRKSSFENARNFSQQLIFYMIQKAFFFWWLIYLVFFKSFGCSFCYWGNSSEKLSSDRQWQAWQLDFFIPYLFLLYSLLL